MFYQSLLIAQCSRLSHSFDLQVGLPFLNTVFTKYKASLRHSLQNWLWALFQQYDRFINVYVGAKLTGVYVIETENSNIKQKTNDKKFNKKDGYRQRNVRQFLQESRRYVVAFSRCGLWHLATSRESNAHFGLLWVHPWYNRGKCHMDRKRIQCLSNASQHVPIYLKPVIQLENVKVRHFSSFFCTFWPPLDTPLGQSR